MPNRQLLQEELANAWSLIDGIREKLVTLSGGDRELLFAYRRKVYKELVFDERGKPMDRRALKKKKWHEQRGLCAICNKELPRSYTVLDRFMAVDGYTVANTRLIHHACDVDAQRSKGYA